MSKIKPQRVSEEMVLKEIDEQESKRLTTLRGISDFGKKSLLFVGLLASLIVIGTIYDAIFSASSMLENAPILGSIYIILLMAFISLLGMGFYNQFKGYMQLKRITSLQSVGLALLKGERSDVRLYAQKVIENYKNHSDSEIVESVKKFEDQLSTMLDSEVLDTLDDTILKPIDKKAQNIILNYSSQTALSTAISPVAFIDAILIISRSHVMITDVSTLYGYKPNFVGELLLVKAVIINLAFASVSELLSHHSGDIFGSSLLSKFSVHSAQGIANGVLMARVGLGTIRSVRPFVYKEKNEGFLSKVTKSIVEKVFKAK